MLPFGINELSHFQGGRSDQASGRLHVVMQDGTEFDTVAGDVVVVPSGHDAWVVGEESVVLINWHGATNYAKP